MNLKEKFLSAKGRMNRSKYLIATLILQTIIFVSMFLFGMALMYLGSFGKSSILYFTLSIFCLLVIYAAFVISIKRFHDLNLSAWWILAFMIPLVNVVLVVILFFKKGTAGENKFGPDPLQGRGTVKEPIIGDSINIQSV